MPVSFDEQKELGAQHAQFTSIDWPTWLLLVLCTFLLLIIATMGSSVSLWFSVPVLALLMTLHSSLQHEVLHGHPTSHKGINELLVCIPFGLFVPYRRFRDTHLEHHIDERLTDPHEDPESNYLQLGDWEKLSKYKRRLLLMNNTLAGRIFLGPLIGMSSFYCNDFRLARAGDHSITKAYLLHVLAMLPLMWLLDQEAAMPFLAYIMSAYLALSILRVRTFLEHRAEWEVLNRIVVIEDRGLFSWLFLNNNYHLVHHLHPGVCWYKLPAMFRANRDRYLLDNGSYYYPNYRSIFARYFFKAKDPVPHPMSCSGKWQTAKAAEQ